MTARADSLPVTASNGSAVATGADAIAATAASSIGAESFRIGDTSSMIPRPREGIRHLGSFDSISSAMAVA